AHLLAFGVAVGEMRKLVLPKFRRSGQTMPWLPERRVGVLQVWQKQGDRWKLLARQAFRLPAEAVDRVSPTRRP
ncbi:MAG TPA: hypothetical protein VJS37_12660, partial [Terriglobales bacterium]|nr:hypothetical protein [Terriglobales bacterium]